MAALNRSQLTQGEERELIDLWRRRASLGAKEWSRLLYELIYTELSANRSANLARFPNERKEGLVHDYLLAVFDGRNKPSELAHAGALHTFFERFLSDRARYERLRAPVADPVEELPYSPDPRCGESAGSELLPAMRERVASSVPAFIESLESDDQRYLLQHQCTDAGPRGKFATERGIGNSHAKALRLGITRARGEFHRGYEKTVLGGWLTRLGLKPVPENWDAICEAFALLCERLRSDAEASHGPA